MSSPSQILYGATEKEWDLAIRSELRPFILPIVSNIHAAVLQGSSLARSNTLGKVPSVISRGKVVGLKSWTTYTASDKQLAEWRADSTNYGFCIRLDRGFIAIDCDVNNPQDAAAIKDMLISVIGTDTPLPLRQRGTARWATIVRIKGIDTFNKRVLDIGNGDKVELLGTGQQLACCGTHPSGARYAWHGADPFVNTPELTPEQLQEFTDNICMIYDAAESEVTASRRERGQTFNAPDDVAEWLIAHGQALGQGADKELYITCPWSAEHTDTTGPRETVYFPIGSNGYAGGAFKCLHAHCQQRTLDDFRTWLKDQGFEATSSEAYPDEQTAENAAIEAAHTAEAQAEEPARPLSRDDREEVARVKAELMKYYNENNGSIKTGYTTVTMAVGCPAFIGYELAWDTFTSEMSIRKYGAEKWEPYSDTKHTIPMIIKLENLKFKLGTISQTVMYSVAETVAFRRKRSSVRDYLQEFLPEWDGVPRAEHFFDTYCGTESTEFTRAVGRYLFGMLYGRATAEKPIKADISVVLVGRQGARKSTCAMTLALKPEWCVGVNMRMENKEIAQRIQGKTVVEIGEMAGMTKKDADELKDFLTIEEDQWRPPYGREQRRSVRNCLFIMTTNEMDFLTDTTGNRRYAAIQVGDIDIDAIQRDLGQLWAEGKQILQDSGVNKLHRDVEKLQPEFNSDNVLEDPWEDAIESWFDGEYSLPKAEQQVHNTRSILKYALGFNESSIEAKHTRRCAKLLRKLGFLSKAVRIGSEVYREWRRGDPEETED